MTDSAENGLRRHRVTKTHAALYSPPRTLRKRRRCGGHLSNPHWIEVGEQAIWSSLPPQSEIGNEGWWHAVFCMDCAPAECVIPPAAWDDDPNHPEGFDCHGEPLSSGERCGRSEHRVFSPEGRKR